MSSPHSVGRGGEAPTLPAEVLPVLVPTVRREDGTLEPAALEPAKDQELRTKHSAAGAGGAGA